MSLSILVEVYRRRIGDGVVPARQEASRFAKDGKPRKQPKSVSAASRMSVLAFFALKADEDGGNIWPTKATIERSVEMSERQVRMVIETLLLPTPFGRPLIAKDGMRKSHKGYIQAYRIDRAALEALPLGDEEPLVMGGTEFTPEGNSVQPIAEQSSAQGGNSVHPDKPSEKPSTDLFQTRAASQQEATEDAKNLACSDEIPNEFVLMKTYPRRTFEMFKVKAAWEEALEQGLTPHDITDRAEALRQQVEAGALDLHRLPELHVWLGKITWQEREQPSEAAE